MSEELKNICENCNFNNDFAELLEIIENHHNAIANSEESSEDSLIMVNWILENTDLKVFKNLLEKERFILGIGVLMNEIKNY